MSPADAKPSAPDLLIMAADTIGNRAAERDSAEGERSMARAVQMFNVWRGPRAQTPMNEPDGWVDGAAYMALCCESIERELDMPF